ncbi:hypothetical protein CGRA01v4_03233 [Colletotrichum graminicola]|nr:hypothetical protein CGRA01v4_03233 [Colletotrichum graminicola]
MPCHAVLCVVSAGVSEALRLAAAPPPTPSLPHHAYLPRPVVYPVKRHQPRSKPSVLVGGCTTQPDGPGPGSLTTASGPRAPAAQTRLSLVSMTNAGPGRAHRATW